MKPPSDSITDSLTASGAGRILTGSGCSAVGSAPRLGRGGRRFKSAHPDRPQLTTGVPMRGQRSSIAGKKIDVVLVAARYGPDGQRLSLARGHSRRGAVWGGLELFERQRVPPHPPDGP